MLNLSNKNAEANEKGNLSLDMVYVLSFGILIDALALTLQMMRFVVFVPFSWKAQEIIAEEASKRDLFHNSKLQISTLPGPENTFEDGMETRKLLAQGIIYY